MPTKYLFVLLVAFVSPAVGQQTATKDPSAMAIAQASLAAMTSGGSAVAQDSQALGTLTMYFDQPVSMPVTLESKGFTEVRVTVQQANGPGVRILNGTQAVVQKPDGSLIQVNLMNTQAEYVRHIPALSLLSQIQGPATNVTLLSSSATNGTSDDVIAISYVPSSDPGQAQLQSQTTLTRFYVNHASSLVDEIEYSYYPEDGSAPMDVQELFSDYRSVGGFMVPFHRTTYRDGNLESDLQLQSIAFNVGVPDSDFTLPGGQQ
jgi:hypothetical protein